MARPVQPPPPNAVYIASWEMSSKRIALGTEGTAYTITIGNTTGAPQVEMYVQAYLTQGGIIDEAGGGTITLCPNEPPGTIPVGGCTFDYAVYPFLGSLTAGQAILELELFDFDRGGTGQNTTLDTRSMKVRLVAP